MSEEYEESAESVEGSGESDIHDALNDAFNDAEPESTESGTGFTQDDGQGDVDTTLVQSVEGETAQPASYKAPQSWGVAEREAWANIPPEVQAQIDKREKEIGHSLTTTGEARKFQSEFQQTIQPFQSFMQAEGATPMQAVGNLLQTAATLQGGSQHQKAQRIAELIGHYGIDINTLDSMLAGEQPDPAQQQNNQMGAMINQAMAPVNNFMQQQQFQNQQAMQASQEATQTEIGTFLGKHEFAADVRLEMADLMEMAGRRNQTLTLDQAYERALAIRPDIQQVIQQRQAGNVAQQGNQSIAQKRNAAVSVPGGQAMQTGAAKPASMRDAIVAAMGEQ